MIRHPALRSVPRLGAARPGRPRVQYRSFIYRRNPRSSSGRAVEGLNIRQMSQQREEYERMRRNFLTAGAVAGIISFIYTAFKLKQALNNPTKLDSNLPASDPLVVAGAKRKTVLHDEEGHEIVPTGNSTVPTFPRTIDIPVFADTPAIGPTADPAIAPATAVLSAASGKTEYTLVGLGTRSVSFLGINVYIVGFYIATADIATLQSRLVKKINPIATTLVSGEKDDLRRVLLDPAEGEELWNELLREGIPARTAFRILPVRDTDFHHLRDGFVRAIQARSDKIIAESSEGGLDNDAFGESVRQFRQAFKRGGKVPKAEELMLIREDGGKKLRIVYSDGSKKRRRQLIGTVDNERLSRALWLNWLAGKKVASEEARRSIVEGIMEFVERPVGTVAAQVV